MSNLQIDVKEFIIEFKSDRGDEPAKAIYVNETLADAYRRAWQSSHIKTVDIHDDDGNYKETVETRLIKRIAKASEPRGSTNGLMAVCEYGTRHPYTSEGFEKCECQKRFNGILPNTFAGIIIDNFPDVNYSTDITPEIQSAMEKICKTLDCKSGYTPLCRKDIKPKSVESFKSFESILQSIV